MTGTEIAWWLLRSTTFCVDFCGSDYELSCGLIYGVKCPHQVAHTMYKIAVDMLETA